MAHVLFLTMVLPYPLDAGPKVRQYHMLRHLAGSHKVTLVSFTRPDDGPGAIAHLESICHAVYPVPMHRSGWRNVRAGAKGMLTGLPILVARNEIREMAAVLQRLTAANKYDLIHADQLSMAWYGQMAARMARFPRPGTLLDEHNAIYAVTSRLAELERNPARRMVGRREVRAFKRYEAGACRAFDAVLTVTEEDREHLLALFPAEERGQLAGKFSVVPICIDPEQALPVVHKEAKAPTVLHLGTMFWPPNVGGVLWFAREVLPLIRRQVPEARFVVVGKNPPPEVQALASDPGVQVTGYVLDPMPYLEAADAFVVPLHAGGGMRVKIVEAWQWGLPIVSTPMGAEGIQVRDEENILLAQDAQAFAQATLRLLTDPDLNRRLRLKGRAWVEDRYAWQTVYRQVDGVYDKLLETRMNQN